MPQHNVLVTGPLMQTNATDPMVRSGGGVNRGIQMGIGSVHLTIIGMVVLAVAGLALLNKAGFRFSVTVGGRGR